jgi:hypothetical protein
MRHHYIEILKIIKKAGILLIFILSINGFSYMIRDIESKCPICGTTNKHLSGSFKGVYPEPYNLMRLIPPPPFSPEYEPEPPPYLHIRRGLPSIYSCKKCRLNIFVGDFYEFKIYYLDNDEKGLQELKRSLDEIRIKENLVKNQEIPYSKKIEILEILYSKYGHLLTRIELDDYFGLRIYSTLFFEYKDENLIRESLEAEKKTMMLLERMLKDPKYKKYKKELLYYYCIMHHFGKNDIEALANLKSALRLSINVNYSNWLSEDSFRVYDRYLSYWILNDIQAILEPEKKRNFIKWLYEMGSVYFIYFFGSIYGNSTGEGTLNDP